MNLGTADAAGEARCHLDVNGIRTDVIRRGSGRSVLYLHSHLGFWKDSPFIDALSGSFAVIEPAHPGFESSDAREDITTVDDLGYFYLDLIEMLDLRDVAVVGSSFGAWIALSIAMKDCSRISSLVLVNPVGAHLGAPDAESIADIFSLDEAEFARRGFAEPAQGRKDFPNMGDQELLTSARNREAAARYAWNPCFYDPKLPSRLHRIKRPTHVICGAQDQITAPGYGQALAALLPQCDYQEIAGAGHFPYIERPAETAEAVATAINSTG